MGNYTGGAQHDPELDRMRAARERSVVLKTKLISFRSQDTSTYVFVFEGPDDPLVYRQWIKRISEELVYEPMTCSGKGVLLEFMSMMERDANGFGEKMLYFIDADFDGSRGFSSEKLFITRYYSVENYLVEPQVVDETLKSEFYCALEPAIRERVINAFNVCYEEFLDHTSPINARIFASRILKIKMKRPIPDRINGIASVSLCSVSCGAAKPEQTIVLEREPTDAEWREITPLFSGLSRREAYRGKFAIMFFLKWIEALHAEYKQDEGFFKGMKRTVKARVDEIGLGNLASKSSMPEGLSSFIARAV